MKGVDPREKEDFHDIDTLGHFVQTKWLREQLEERYETFVKVCSEKSQTPEELAERLRYHVGPESVGESFDCALCGAAVRFHLTDGPGSEIKAKCYAHDVPWQPLPLEVDNQTEDEHGRTRFYQWIASRDYKAPDDFRCPVTTIEPVVCRFVSESGVVVLGNDLRRAVGQSRDRNEPHTWAMPWRYKGVKGHAEEIRHRAAEGYLTGYVGDGGVFFIEEDGVLKVVDYRGDEEGYCNLEESCLHQICMELWRFAIVDRKLIKTEPPWDSYDREAFVYELPGGPGEYEFTYHQEQQWKAREPGILIWATLKKVSDD